MATRHTWDVTGGVPRLAWLGQVAKTNGGSLLTRS
jgi:hypothetical protein